MINSSGKSEKQPAWSLRLGSCASYRFPKGLMPYGCFGTLSAAASGSSLSGSALAATLLTTCSSTAVFLRFAACESAPSLSDRDSSKATEGAMVEAQEER